MIHRTKLEPTFHMCGFLALTANVTAIELYTPEQQQPTLP